MRDSTYRLVYAGLGLVLVAVVALTVAFGPSGDETGLPEPIERVFPLPNGAVIRQAVVEIDTQVGYDIDLFVDDVRISPAEIDFQTGTSIFTWRPGPGRFFESWEPGVHEIRVEYDRTFGLPDPGDFTWTFRVQ